MERAVASERRDRIAELYALHAADAARLAYLLTGTKEVAAEVVQDAFVRIMGRFGDLRSTESFKEELRDAVIRVARSRARRKRSGWLDEAVSKKQAKTINDEVWVRLQSLPFRQRAAVVLRYYEDLSEVETADVLGCSPGAVKALETRGMAVLRGEAEVG